MDHDRNAVREPVSVIRAAYAAAVVARDANAIGQVYAEDAVVLPATGHRCVGRDAILASYQATFDLGASTFSAEPTSLDLSGDLAIEEGTAAFSITPEGGEAQEVQAEYRAVIKRTDDDWRIFRLASKPIPPAA